jgi:micrococcal nuclease
MSLIFPTYTYNAKVVNSPYPTEIMVDIDCGFRVTKKEVVQWIDSQGIRSSQTNMPQIQAPIIGTELVIKTTKDTNRLPGSFAEYTAEEFEPNNSFRYRYKALVTSVIDGDTFICTIDVGFGVFGTKVPVRMQGINAPAITGSTRVKGLASKSWLESQILGQEVYLRTWDMEKQFEKYGRYLALVYKLSAEELADSVNAASIRAKHSVYYAVSSPTIFQLP